LGYNAVANGLGSIALGTHSLTGANASLSLSIGSRVSTDALYNIVMGFGSDDELLYNDIEKSLMIGFDSDLPTLFIGPSSGTGTIGRVGIGTTDPSALLEVNGNLKVTDEAIIHIADIEDLLVSNSVSLSNLDITGIRTLIGHNNKLILQNNASGSAQMTFASNGNIGVGSITSPAHAFEIAGDFSVSDYSYFQDNIVQSPNKYLATSQIKAPANQSLTLTDNSDNGIFIKDGGNVGIGTSNPGKTLDIAGEIRVSELASSSGFQMIVSGTDGTLSMQDIPVGDNLGMHTATQNLNLNGNYLSGDGSNEGVFVDADGNVGIGTNNPGNALDVIGTVAANSFVGDGSLLTGMQGDNLGNHSMTQKLITNGNWITGDGGTGEGIFVDMQGKVGIGTANPQSALEVNGSLRLLSNSSTSQLQILSDGQIPLRRGISLTDDPDGAFNFYIHGWQDNAAFNFVNSYNLKNLLTIKSDGSIGIGTENPSEGAKLTVYGKLLVGDPTSCNLPDGYKLFVEDGILTEKLSVKTVSNWADDVFDKNYQLLPIYKLEGFINENKHLPNIPSESEIKEKGYDVADMDALLLRKIEELSLYVIELKKENEMMMEIIKKHQISKPQ